MRHFRSEIETSATCQRFQYNKDVENSYAPPEVIRQYANQSDQKDDQADDTQDTSTTSSSPAPTFDPSQFSGSAGSAGSPAATNQGNALAGQDFMGSGGEGGKAQSSTLSPQEQLKMLSPLGIITALLGFEPTQQEQEAQQKKAAQQEKLVFQSQQSRQARQGQEQQAQMALREEQETIRSQGRTFGQPRPDSVLFQRITDQPSQTDTQLLTRSAKDAQELRTRNQQAAGVPQGRQQGPVDFGTLAKQSQGMQKASEMTMGE